MKNTILWLIAIFAMLFGLLVMPGGRLQTILGCIMFAGGIYIAYELTKDS